MKKNTVKRRLADGQAVFGSWISLGSPLATEYMSHVGWDFLVVDTEHSPIGFETTIECFRAIATTDTIPLARAAWNDLALFKRLLDGGAFGLVVPMVNSVAEAERAVSYMRYPPEGVRGIAGGRAMVYGPDYMLEANREIMCIVQIEHYEAVAAAEGILSVEGVDVGFVGPMDLSVSLGIKPGQHRGNAENERAIQRALDAGNKVGKPMGIYTFGAEDANHRLEQGFRFLNVTNDRSYMIGAAKQALSDLQRSR